MGLRSGNVLPPQQGTDPVVVQVENPGRVDVLVSRSVVGCSRRHVHDLFACGAVRINGRRARKGDYVQAGDRVTVDRSPLAAELAALPALPVRIVYEDESVVVVDKPAGMPSTALRAADTGTVANFLIGRFPEMRTVSANPLEAGLVHRLDTATSGALLAARTASAHERLRHSFTPTAIKDYLAVTVGVPLRAGHITFPIAHVPRHPRRMCVCADPDEARKLSARRADTSYRVIQSDRVGALVVVRIRTGVRHQIRVHLAAAGHAIVGDDLYARANTGKPQALLLHAFRLRVPHPTQPITLDAIAELPDHFAAVLSARGWRKPQPSDWDDI